MRHPVRATILVGCAVLFLMVGCVSTPRHPNLESAQQLVQQAIDSISAAQGANNYDMKGHATKAKKLLQDAMSEIQLAEAAADQK